MRPGRRSARPSDERVLRAAAGVMVGFLLVGTSLVLASVLVHGSDDDRASRTGTVTSTAVPERSSAPSAEPSVAAAPRMRARTMTAFLRGYLAEAPRAPATTWRDLTGRFQRASGGVSAYQEFWAPIGTATAFGIFADPRAHRITYRVRYTYPDRRVVVDSTRLELVLSNDGTYRIDGEG